MESHILNTYHQAHFRPIGHKILRMKNDSLSSESSYNQSSPEYPEISEPQSRLSVDSNTVDWDQIQTVNITQTSQDTSWDYKSFGLEECMEDLEQNGLEENVEISGEELKKAICRQEVHFDYNDDEIIEFNNYRDVMHRKSHHTTQMTESNNTEDNSLVEGRDYDVIIVYPINPDLVDSSSDGDIETVDYSIDQHDLEAEYISGDDRSYLEVNHEDQNTISRDGLDIDLDSPLLFNIDEYLIHNNNNEHLLNTDDSVIKDVDKYFIKENGKENTLYNDFFIEHKLPKESRQFHIPVFTSNEEECLISDDNKDVVVENTEINHETDNCQVIDQDINDNPDISLNEADLEDLPDFEGLKDYLLEDMTYTKFSHIQTSCLCPQSPMQNICMDNDVVKTCMRMNLSDLAIDNGKNSTEKASQSDEMPRTLTDIINSDQITINNKMEPKLDPEKKNLGHKDEEIKRLKKLHSLPKFKGGQIILEPEVLPSSSRSSISRHRSCKRKQVVSHVSADEKIVMRNTNNKKDNKKKSRVKLPLQSKCHKKLSPPYREPDSFRAKSNSSVMIQSAFKTSDHCSEQSTSSIKLTIKNKSKVVLHCEHIGSQKYKNIDKCENSDREITKNGEKNIHKLDRSNEKIENIVEAITVEEKPHPKNENIYTTLFGNKQHVQIPQALQSKRENRTSDDELNKCMLEVDTKKEAKDSLKNEKQEYKLRKDNCSNNSSAIVSPKFSNMLNSLSNNVIKSPKKQTTPNGLLNSLDKANDEQNLLDPIKEAARIVAKKRKAEAMRKREEDVVNSRLHKVKNLQLQPLFSDAKTMKIVGMTKPEIMPVPLEKLQLSADYEKIILVNIGTITDQKLLSYVEELVVEKKSGLVLKTDKTSPVDEKTHSNIKIDKERFKNITATLESLRKQVVTKMLSNSLFSSIQDVIMKNAPKEAQKHDERHKRLQEKRDCKFTKIVRQYDPKGEHGEDKVILYLDKHRRKPSFSNVAIQTDPVAEFAELPMPKERVGPMSRKRNYSDLSLSSDESRLLKSNERQLKLSKLEDRVSKPKELRLERTETKEKRSREIARSMTVGPLRKPAVSESSDSSSSLSSSSKYSSSSTSSKRSRRSCSSYKRDKIFNQKSYRRETETPVEERRIVFVGRLKKDVTKQVLRNQFSKFGRVTEVRLHSKEDGYRYGFVTYQRARDAWSAVEASSTFSQYDVGFGGRRAFCKQSYADLDGLDVKYTESAYHGEAVSSPIQRDDDLSYEQMLLEMKKKLGQRKSAKKS